MQKWDYKTIYRTRSWERNKPLAEDTIGTAGTWEYWAEDDNEIPIVKNLTQKLKELGAQGWELVEIVPRSNHFGGISSQNRDYAGLTTAELWVFKRPSA